MSLQSCRQELARVAAELAQVNELYLVLRTEQLQVSEDFRTSQAELLRVHNEHRLAHSALLQSNEDTRQTQLALLLQSNEETRQSQLALLQAADKYQTSATKLRESHQREMSNLAAINYREQSKLHAMNLVLVADKQKLLLERSLLDGNDSVPGMFPTFSHISIGSLTTTQVR